ncbi:MAG: hypothetical protein U5J83_09790 [Bryobacterales bacterium]|nr:hypothetical protein [Bryobacterales bacterium]
MLRQLGQREEALQALSASLKADPLDVRAMAERYLNLKDASSAKALTTAMIEHPATAQATADDICGKADGSMALRC